MIEGVRVRERTREYMREITRERECERVRWGYGVCIQRIVGRVRQTEKMPCKRNVNTDEWLQWENSPTGVWSSHSLSKDQAATSRDIQSKQSDTNTHRDSVCVSRSLPVSVPCVSYLCVIHRNRDEEIECLRVDGGKGYHYSPRLQSGWRSQVVCSVENECKEKDCFRHGFNLPFFGTFPVLM